MGTLLVIYWWLNRVQSYTTALIATVIFFTAWLPLQMAGAVVLNPFLVFVTTIVMVTFWQGTNETQTSVYVWLMWIALGVGLLVKGPVAFVLCGLPALAWDLLSRQWSPTFKVIRPLRGITIMLLIAAPTYAIIEWHTPGFLEDFSSSVNTSNATSSPPGQVIGMAGSKTNQWV